MNISIISFTKNGIELSKKLSSACAKKCGEYKFKVYTKYSMILNEITATQNVANGDSINRNSVEKNALYPIIFTEQSIGEWAGEQLREKNILLFIGASGIAVRAIAPYLTDKFHDSPVLVMDEKGEYVIPILSGHMGGANEIAIFISEAIGAVPVITTATDINHKYAVDIFAKKNNLFIVNKEGIAKVSSKVLAEKDIMISIEPGHFPEDCKLPDGIHMSVYPPEQFVDIVISTEELKFDAALLLRPREYVLGMGCRKGKETDQIEAFIQHSMQEAGIGVERLLALTSINLKKEEQGFIQWSRKNQIPFITYTAEQLKEVDGEFHTSDFVLEKVGVDNVCERAALKACGTTGTIVYEKHAEVGMTIAIAKKDWQIEW